MTDHSAPTNDRGLRIIRTALSLSHGRLDRYGRSIPTRDFAIETGSGTLRARLYQPRPVEAAAPGLVFFHGGGFVLCDIETHDALCRRLAANAHLPIVSVDYRLAPEAPFPAQLEDGEAALSWVKLHGKALGIDPERLLAGGDSAGAYIALAAAATLNAKRAKTVAGLLLIYPLLELGDEAWSSAVFAHSRLVGRMAVGYIRRQLQLNGPTPSLVAIDPDRIPPSVIVVGGALDPCRPDARLLAERLREVGKLSALLEFPRLPHGFASLTSISRASGKAVAAIGGSLALLGQTIRRQTIGGQ